MIGEREVFWDGVPLCETYGLFVEYGSVSESPPKPKLSVVSIPGGEDIDLTDALTGHAAFESRTVSFSLYYDGRGSRGWREVASEVANLMNGREADFELGWDPGYTYHGRVSNVGVEFVPRGSCRIAVEITASPWRVLEEHHLTVEAVPGKHVLCRSGRRPVHPAVTCNYPTTVNWQGSEFVVPAGQKYRMLDVTFEQGDNDLYLSVSTYRSATWADLASRKWEDVAGYTWDGLSVREGETDPGDFAGHAIVDLWWEESYL